jgi:hypothetical protein
MASNGQPAATTTPNGLPDEVITCLQNARFVSTFPATFASYLVSLLNIPHATLVQPLRRHSLPPFHLTSTLLKGCHKLSFHSCHS